MTYKSLPIHEQLRRVDQKARMLKYFKEHYKKPNDEEGNKNEKEE